MQLKKAVSITKLAVTVELIAKSLQSNRKLQLPLKRKKLVASNLSYCRRLLDIEYHKTHLQKISVTFIKVVPLRKLDLRQK